MNDTNEKEQTYVAGDFFPIPGFSRYAISKDGRLWDLMKERFIKCHKSGGREKNPHRYRMFHVEHDDGRFITTGRHRLLALAFIKRPETDEYLIVNHIDGIPGNDALDNLEWCTYRQNAVHAGKLGLTPKCLPISVRDVDTGEVKHYDSFLDRAEEVGVSRDYMAWRLKFGEDRVFPERKQYRRYKGDTPWIVPDDIERALMVNDTEKPVAVRWFLTGLEMKFPKLTDLSVFLDVSLPVVSKWVNQEGQPMLPGYIQVKLLEKGEPWREIKDPYLELQNVSGRKLVKATNSATGEFKIYDSCVDCAKAMGIHIMTLFYRLNLNRTKPFSDGFSYQYYIKTVQQDQGHLR